MNEILEYINENLDVKSKIVADIKKKGYNTRQVSVKQDREAIFLTIRDYNVKISDIDNIAKKYDNYETDGQGSIMSGGNTYVFVKVMSGIENKLKDFFASKFHNKIGSILNNMIDSEEKYSAKNILYKNKGYTITVYINNFSNGLGFSLNIESERKNLNKEKGRGYGDDPKEKTDSITIWAKEEKSYDLDSLVDIICTDLSKLLIKTEQVDIFTEPKGFKFKEKKPTKDQIINKIENFLKDKYGNSVGLESFKEEKTTIKIYSQINFFKVKEEIFNFISKKIIKGLVWIDFIFDENLKSLLLKDITMNILLDRIKLQFEDRSIDIFNNVTVYKDKLGNAITMSPVDDESWSLDIETSKKDLVSLYDGKKKKSLSFRLDKWDHKLRIPTESKSFSIDEVIFLSGFPLYKDGVE